MNRSVLGIDAAWTASNPSGVALAVEDDGRWRLAKASSSYADFIGPTDPAAAGSDSSGTLLSAAQALTGQTVTLVAADIPLARSPITARRFSDDQVSVAYGARHASTHTPNPSRPGKISTVMQNEFLQWGYPLSTQKLALPALIEVYPHPALIELTNADRRLPYKEGKVRKYWPDLAMHERRTKLVEQWNFIVEHLERHITGVAAAFPPLTLPASRTTLKGYEDALDAVVCAWVGICALEGRAVPFGDDNSAIWVPIPNRDASNHHPPKEDH